MLAVALLGCGPPEKIVVLHPGDGDGARRLFDVDLVQRITLPDNFVLRPDEYAAVRADNARQRIYVGSRDGNLLALDERGEVDWAMQLGGAVSSLPSLAPRPVDDGTAVDDGMLLVGTDNGELIAIDLDEVEILWRYQTDGKIRNPAIAVENVAYFVNSRDQVFALDARTGQWRWQYEQELQTDFTVHGHAGLTFVPPGDDAPPDAAATIYTGFENGKVAALSANSGEALWLASVAPPGGGDFVDCDSTPLVDRERGFVVVSGQSTGVHALSIDDGSLLWDFPVRAAGTVVAGRAGDLVAASSLAGVFALDGRGDLLWRQSIDPGVVSTPTVIDDTVFVTHSDSGLLAFDVETGEFLAQIDLGSGMSSVPVYDPVSRRLFATTNRGLLMALSIEPWQQPAWLGHGGLPPNGGLPTASGR